MATTSSAASAIRPPKPPSSCQSCTVLPRALMARSKGSCLARLSPMSFKIFSRSMTAFFASGLASVSLVNAASSSANLLVEAANWAFSSAFFSSGVAGFSMPLRIPRWAMRIFARFAATSSSPGTSAVAARNGTITVSSCLLSSLASSCNGLSAVRCSAMSARPGATRSGVICNAPNAAPHIATRIQDLYGVTGELRIAAHRIPLVIQVLAPNHRPIQITQNLTTFWKDSYPKIKQELQRKYPRHEWR
ncbi:MAG: hypothetical protein EBY09_03950 [Verrucomicrobia bacterium]|nr:hypothetical protein [Verrucomicrobiota bacterium]